MEIAAAILIAVIGWVLTGLITLKVAVLADPKQYWGQGEAIVAVIIWPVLLVCMVMHGIYVLLKAIPIPNLGKLTLKIVGYKGP